MDNKDAIHINIDKSIVYLHSESNIYKTERFVKTTKYVLGIDRLLEVIAGGIKYEISSGFFGAAKSYMVETKDSEFTIFCRIGKSVKDGLKSYDIVFYKFISKEKLDKANDRRVENYLSKSDTIAIDIHRVSDAVDETAFNKLYILTQTDGVNFPLLNDSQMGIVQIEDKNVLVQGVAGSGKTNICIDKIVFSACREYHGRTLYTTYSRGLLLDTKLKVEAFKHKLSRFVDMYKQNKIHFVDGDKKTAIEDYLGVYFDCDGVDNIVSKIGKIVDYLDGSVDYYLLHDLYKHMGYGGANFVDQNYFINTYLKDIKNHQLSSKLDKVKHLSFEVIYKEIYGLINGRDVDGSKLSLSQYIDERKNSFSKAECEVIYSLGMDYSKYMAEHNLVDNNTISRTLLGANVPLYSLSVVAPTQ